MGEPNTGPDEGRCVVFDMDGVLVDSEPLWVRARQDLVRDVGGQWLPEAETARRGVSSAVWSVSMRDRLGVPLPPAEIREDVLGRMAERYRHDVPLIPGARRAVEVAAACRRTGVASGSDRVLLDAVLSTTGLGKLVSADVAGDEVSEGKPSPAIYQEVCRRLGADPRDCLAVEDSGAGILSAVAAGMRVVAIPRPGFAPDDETLARATSVLASIEELTDTLIADLLGR